MPIRDICSLMSKVQLNKQGLDTVEQSPANSSQDFHSLMLTLPWDFLILTPVHT